MARFRTPLLIVANAALLAAGTWLTATGSDTGADFPQGPVKLVVPFGAGGGSDAFARIVKKAIDDHELLPQPLVVVNRGGAGATIGSRYAKNAPPDGYTVLILHDAIFTAQASGLVEYGAEAFEPVAATGRMGMIIAVATDAPYESIDELLQAAREQLQTVRFGANLGALTHAAGLQLENARPGAKFRFIQSGGGADRFAHLKGGHIDVTGFSIEEFVRFREGGLRGLAHLGETPHAAAPEVPVVTGENGEPVVNSNTFYWWVPRGTPQDRIDVLADALEEAMRTDDVRDRLEDIHCETVFLRDEPLKSYLEQAGARFETLEFPRAEHVPDVPAMLFGTTGLVSLVLVIIAVRTMLRRRGEAPVPTTETEPVPTRNGAALLCLGVLLIYVAALTIGRPGFTVATIGAVLAIGLILERGRMRRLPQIALLAQSLGFGLFLLFVRLFEIDLP